MKFLVLLLSNILTLYSGSSAQKYVGPIHIPVITPDGVPIETQEVRAAKAHHMQAHAAALAAALATPDRSDYENNGKQQQQQQLYSKQVYDQIKSSLPSMPPLAAWPGPYSQVAPTGTTVDSPEAMAAKHQHFNDYWEAAKRNSLQQYQQMGQNALPAASRFYPVHQSNYQSNSHVLPGFPSGAYPVLPGQHQWRRRRSVLPHAYPMSQLYPTIGHDGMPLETPEVQEAKSRHFEQLARETIRNTRGLTHYLRKRNIIKRTRRSAQYVDHNQADLSDVHPALVNHLYQQALANHPVFGRRGAYSGHNMFSGQSPYGIVNQQQAFVHPIPTSHTSPTVIHTNYAPYKRTEFSSYHYPVMGPGGVPTEPPAVQQARAFHLAAHARAKLRASGK